MAAQMQALIGASPQQRDLPRSRWWLDGIRQAVDELREHSLMTVQRLLVKLNLRYKRGRRYVHSPDPDYDRKLSAIAQVRAQVQADPARYVLLYEDEFSYYRRPSVAQGYALGGSDAPRALQGWGSNTRRRIAALLNAMTGTVLFEHRSRCGRAALIALFAQAQQAYPQADRIFIVLDNWSVHFHPEVLSSLRESCVELLPLPTYAPWTNPIEKLWHWLYKDLLSLHPFAHDWLQLQHRVSAWLDQFRFGSLDLLRYVGLYPV
jgi:transposase